MTDGPLQVPNASGADLDFVVSRVLQGRKYVHEEPHVWRVAAKDNERFWFTINNKSRMVSRLVSCVHSFNTVRELVRAVLSVERWIAENPLLVNVRV
jgi:hypothetical protein